MRRTPFVIFVVSVFASCGETSDTRRLDADSAPDGVLFPDAPLLDTSPDSSPADTQPDTATSLDIPSDAELAHDTSDVGEVELDASPPSGDTATSDATQSTDTSMTTCGTEQLSLSVELVPTGVMLVVDRSGSMYDRWDGAIAAVESLIAEVGHTIRLGLALYPESSGCGVSELPIVPLGPATDGLVLEALRNAGTGGSTPMGRAMRSVRDYLEGAPQPGEVAVVLVADGKPSDTCLEDCEGCDCIDNEGCYICADLIACTQREVSKHVEALTQLGTRTWVIGYEGGFGASPFLESLAEAGGTANEGPSPFFDAGEGEALGRILGDIASTVATCTARVTEPAGYGYPVVTLSGAPIPRDPSRDNGWDWLDGETIRLYGEACARASEPGAELAITFICKQR